MMVSQVDQGEEAIEPMTKEKYGTYYTIITKARLV